MNYAYNDYLHKFPGGILKYPFPLGFSWHAMDSSQFEVDPKEVSWAEAGFSVTRPDPNGLTGKCLAHWIHWSMI